MLEAPTSTACSMLASIIQASWEEKRGLDMDFVVHLPGRQTAAYATVNDLHAADACCTRCLR